MKEPSEAIQAAHDFVDKVDWELIEEAADVGATVVEYLRRNPWMMIAAGTAMAGVGVWQLMDKSGKLSTKAREAADLVRR